MFDVPIVLILFKRSETLPRIMERIAAVQPQKLYLLSDEGRNAEEKKMVATVRYIVESLITWPCEVIKCYAEENRGVHENIGMGARWVFKHEKKAIFLEDDNLPEISFFQYCKDLLEQYENEEKVLWICGTNYLAKYRNKYGHSYMFTKNLLPCGWASWSDKFLKYYDYDLTTIKNENDINLIKSDYCISALFRQERQSILNEWKQKEEGKRYKSWDFHMIYSLHKFKLYGIAPANNLIKNIGVDENSTHGGSSMNNIMSQRFCEIDVMPLEEKLKGPESICLDPVFEKKTGKIILHPLKMRISECIAYKLRYIFNIPDEVHTKEFFFTKGKKS